MPVESVTESLDPTAAASILALAPFPVVVVDGDGRVAEANPAAVRSVPGMRVEADFQDCVPSWLADAHACGRSRASGWIGNRRVHGTAGRWPGGRMAWWLAGDGGPEAAAAGSALDPGGTAFLVEASNQLMSSLNVERSLEITATLAARHLAEVAVVVAPPARRRVSITRVTRAGAVERRVLRVDPAEVPGLSEALQGFPPVPSRWIDPATAPDWLVPDGLAELGSLIVTPLPGNGIPAGALILLRGRGQERFTEPEEALARVFAARAGAAISAALLFTRQSTLARTLAEDLMPPSLTPTSSGSAATSTTSTGPCPPIPGSWWSSATSAARAWRPRCSPGRSGPASARCGWWRATTNACSSCSTARCSAPGTPASRRWCWPRPGASKTAWRSG
ncbi:hypothetical protein ABH926_006848 [Catenulispora sp. GP43]